MELRAAPVRPTLMVTNVFLSFCGWVVDLLYPKACAFCGDPFEEGLSNVLCRPCFLSQAPYEDPVCSHCGISLPSSLGEEGLLRCRDCGEGNYHLDQVRAFGPYRGAWRIAHHAFKFEGMEGLAAPLAQRLLTALPAGFWRDVDGLVPVPLSWDRMRKRGYNPALCLARQLSRETSVPVSPILEKIRSTAPQMTLEKGERLRNPKGAYRAVRKALLPEVAVLVDDVYTTGATLEECAGVLKRAGVGKVVGLVLGRTEHRA